jgi:glycosyltransferase involved in cell wall biosynthesis
VACTLHRLAQAHGHVSALDGPAFPDLVAGVEEDAGETLPAARYERAHIVWALRARRRRQRYAPDVVHAHLATPGLAAATWLAAGDVPLVVTFHLMPIAPRWPKDYFMPIQSERVFAERARRHRGTAFVGGTAADVAAIAKRLPGTHTSLVVHAPPLPPIHEKTPTRLPYPPGQLKLLSVGRLGEQKGFDRLLLALADPRVRDVPWHWVLVGDGKLRAKLEASVSEAGLQGRVTLTGFLPSDRLFEQADLVLCPSRFEGTSLVPLEAILARRPVIASSIPPHVATLGGVPDSLLPDDESKWPEALLRALSDATARDDLCREQSRIVQGDPRERLWEDYKRIYEHVTGSRP